MKNTFWIVWNKTVKIPQYIDGEFIDKYFAEEKKEEIPKKVLKTEDKIETKKLISLLDDKRNQMLSIMLSRFPYTLNDMNAILVKLEISQLECGK